jgi:hypothetical protein
VDASLYRITHYYIRVLGWFMLEPPFGPREGAAISVGCYCTTRVAEVVCATLCMYQQRRAQHLKKGKMLLRFKSCALAHACVSVVVFAECNLYFMASFLYFLGAFYI